MDPKTIGEQIKQAYPQYANVDSATLGNKYLTKYGGAISAVKTGKMKLSDIPEAQRVGVSLGLAPNDVGTETAAQQTSQAKLTDVTKSLDLLEKNLKQIEVSGPIAGRLSFLNSFSGGGIFPEAADYEALRKSLIGPLARQISGEVGVLTDRDIARAEGLLPKITDAKKVRENKLNNLRELIKGKMSTNSIDTLQKSGVLPNQQPKSRFTIEVIQ